MLKRIIIFLSLFSNLIFSGILYSETVRISQVDTSSLLFSQDVNLYVSVTNDGSQPLKGLTQDKFNIFESSDNINFAKITMTLLHSKNRPMLMTGSIFYF